MTFQTDTLSQPDLSACDREPIHIPGSIQPHGILLALAPDNLTISHVSANIDGLLKDPAAGAIGRPLADVLPTLAAALAPDPQSRIIADSAESIGHIVLPTAAGPAGFATAVHRSGELLVIELEETAPGEEASRDTLYPMLQGFVAQLQSAGTPEALSALAAQSVRRLTGFDRVLVYRFDADWNGTVIAEDRNETLPSYLDLRFPASDIPQQARELYRRNRLRIIPDAAYVPVAIAPAHDPRTGAPLDLSQSILRSVSPVHVEYMHNMGTMASMSISILRGGALWGLISCHNKTSRRVPLSVRNACDLLTQIFSTQAAARERAVNAEERIHLGSVQTRLLGLMAAEEHFVDGLLHDPDELMAVARASGAAVVTGDHIWRVGAAPTEPRLRELIAWLSANHREDIFATDSLCGVFPPAQAYADTASGLLAVSISKVHASYILWFRPEVIQTVKWGGDPTKPVEDGPGPARLHPRKSFEVWKEILRHRSLPWKPSEIGIVKELRNAILGIVLRKAEELALLSGELQRSNKELEAFSYSVSHDLRAPFRHIVGYAELLKSHEGGLSDRGRRYIETIIESAFSAGKLVDNLLNFSQMGRTALKPRRLNMNDLVADVQKHLMGEATGRRIEWRLHDLAPAVADPILLRVAVENLLSNAVKYTGTREQAVIEIGCRREPDETVYFVKDNGVGFDMAYVSKLFGVFQRLHRIEEFEGTGIGLANVRRIVERHGGRTWAEGMLDAGATFFFTLPNATGARDHA